ncbi:MAG TPA: hypothetical protein DCR55_13540 [Lentisphaeria bacterium]|nr:hypothetical protein [Lentisphaeria bacterium]
MKSHSLLVGADYGDTTEATIGFAADLAKKLDCRLQLCHVMESLPYAIHSAGPLAEEQMLKENAAELERLASLVSDCPATALPPRIGKPHHVLLEVAKKTDTLAVVIGAAYKPTIERVVVGVTAEKIVQSAVRPVFLYHPKDSHSISKILCAVDYSDHSRRALANAGELAKRLGAQLEAVHIETSSLAHADLYSYQAYPASSPCTQPDTERLRKFVREYVPPLVETSISVRSGAPVAEILAACESSKPDLLVVGSHGAGGFVHRILGNVTTRIVRDVPCTILVIGEECLFSDSGDTK